MSELTPNFGALGMDLEQSLKQLKKGKLTYALNGMIEGFDGQYVNYQNEEGNELCVTFPDGYKVIGIYVIYEQDKIVYFLTNPSTGDSEIGTSSLNDCTYTTIINAKCLNFNIEHPILSAAHRIDNCSTQIFWVDNYNKDRWIDLEKLPYKEVVSPNQCDNVLTNDIDCNKILLNPNFSIPQITLESVDGDGTLLSGAYQFSVQYANASGQAYTSFYSVTNPISIFDPNNVTLDLNAPVNKSIKIKITDLDNTGFYDYINVAVIKTVQGIAVVDQVGTYKIVGNSQTITYTGQKTIDLGISDIFQKYPIYEKSNDITTVNDILVRDQLTSAERLNYQSIANQISIKWQTWKIGRKLDYSDEIIAANFRGYMRDEVYAFEIVFLLADGRQTDRFHIPGRKARPYDLELILNDDTFDCTSGDCEPPQQPLPRWKVYNTATAGCPGEIPPSAYPGPSPTTTTTTTAAPSCTNYLIEQDYTGSGSLQFTYKCCNSGLLITETLTPGTSVQICARTGSIFAGSGIKYQGTNFCNVDVGKCAQTSTGDGGVTVPDEDSIDCAFEPYDCGDMAYWESAETYPCRDDIWGELAGKPIRHHKFPDSLISHIHDDDSAIYPIGIKISLNEIKAAITNSSLTQEQKDEIIGFKIVRGNRANNKSIVAKGIVHNVGVYTKEKNNYFYPNYPYNDVRPDPFISGNSTNYNVDSFTNDTTTAVCERYSVTNNVLVDKKISYADCNGDTVKTTLAIATTQEYCSQEPPILADDGDSSSITVIKLNPQPSPSPCANSAPVPPIFTAGGLNGFYSSQNKRRFVFHSPDTHFYQPFLGNILKLETAEYGSSYGHFVQVKNHAKYKMPRDILYITALAAAVGLGFVSGMFGFSNRVFDGIAFATGYGVISELLEKAVPFVNYAYQYNSYGNYIRYKTVPNAGNKQRFLNLAYYMLPGVANVGDVFPVNNFQRESSVYLRATKALPYSHEIPGVPQDVSRWLPNCPQPFLGKMDTSELNGELSKDVSSFYSSLKKCAPTQYGQIYSYDSVDTGTQIKLTDTRDKIDVFGGDIFINKFAYKSKLPYFFDNRVNAPDGSAVFYNEIGNVGNPMYWFTLDSTKNGTKFKLFSTPIDNFHCKPAFPKPFFYRKGRIYLFSYGIPNFFCESEVNVSLRQAYNNKEGEFWPHVSSYIPDDWLQETNVSINYDNTYYYNKMYSKQNLENEFTFLPPDYDNDKCTVVYPFRAIFSEPSSDDPLSTFNNNWLIYKPSSFFDFPQSFGKLTSLDGIDYRQVLARFENRTQIYNALLTAPTTQADVYLGQPLFSSQTPPIDLVLTDMGYLGTRHKFILRTEFGIVMVDDKRGHVFLLNGRTPKNLTEAASGVEQFFNKNLEIQLVKYFPTLPIDNTYNGVGITGVYDAKYNRLILTKLDYIPAKEGITYQDGKFYYEEEEVQLTDITYFCNKSFTISYDFDYQSWISFHSYLPSYYIGSNNFFFSGHNDKTWRHLTANNYCRFYGEQAPYIIEYPYAFEYLDEILQAVTDYSKTLQYINGDQIEVDDVYFNKVILYNNQQCSGILKLAKKPKNNLSEYMKYPIYATDSKTILYTKSDNLYKINQFWSLVKDIKQPIFKKTCQALSFDKELNQSNMDYSKMSFKKSPLRAKDLKCRFILDDRTDTRIVSQLVAIETQKSYK